MTVKTIALESPGRTALPIALGGLALEIQFKLSPALLELAAGLDLALFG